jgi:hypothetical protein
MGQGEQRVYIWLFRRPTITKVLAAQPKSGEDELREIVLEACRIEKILQAKSGMVVIQDSSDSLDWETAYYTLTTKGDDVVTPPPVAPTEPTSGLRRNKPGSIIDLTADGDESDPPIQKVRTKAEAIVKQEVVVDDTVPKATGKGKAVAKPAKDGAASGGNLKVAAKTYRHGDIDGLSKTTKAETILANIADGLSPQAQEKRETNRMNLLRETAHLERNDRALDDRVQDLKADNQALKKEIEDLRRENIHQRDRATEAITTLNIINATKYSHVPIHPTPYASAMPAFATNPSHYSVPSINHQSAEPVGIAGPGPQTTQYRQQAAEADDPNVDDLKILEEE